MSFVVSVGGLNLSMMERKLFHGRSVSVLEVAGFGRIWSNPISTRSGRLGISRRLSSSCQGSFLGRIAFFGGFPLEECEW